MQQQVLPGMQQQMLGVGVNNQQQQQQMPMQPQGKPSGVVFGTSACVPFMSS
jgi:hypothetical protein